MPGDLIVGCGSKKLGLEERILFAMRVEGKCTFQEYWDDDRFLHKRPYFGGNQRRAYGDNIYHRSSSGGWVQEKSHHSFPDGSTNPANQDRDTGSDNVLWGSDFVYWGRDAIPIPTEFRDFNGDDLYPSGRGHRVKFADDFVQEIEDWFGGINQRQCRGRPASWD